jgi:hypothetical protein
VLELGVSVLRVEEESVNAAVPVGVGVNVAANVAPVPPVWVNAEESRDSSAGTGRAL